jgi:hypothetical protein
MPVFFKGREIYFLVFLFMCLYSRLMFEEIDSNLL